MNIHDLLYGYGLFVSFEEFYRVVQIFFRSDAISHNRQIIYSALQQYFFEIYAVLIGFFLQIGMLIFKTACDISAVLVHVIDCFVDVQIKKRVKNNIIFFDDIIPICRASLNFKHFGRRNIIDFLRIPVGSG